MSHVCTGERGECHRPQTQRKTFCEDTARQWSSAVQVAKECLERRQVDEGRKVSPQDPAEGVGPCQHLDSGFLTSRTVKQEISVVLNHQFMACLLQQP